MASFIKVERTGPAIRAALMEASPDEVPDFEAEFHIALAEADGDFDVSRIDRLIGRWWRIAHLRLNPIPEKELPRRNVLPPASCEERSLAAATSGFRTGDVVHTGLA